MKNRDVPLVTVVTPFYNTSDYLEECIQSVLAQDYANWEYILVNNKSTDASRDIAAKHASAHPCITLVDNEEFLSQVKNYNRALALVGEESEYTKVLEADNWMYPDCLSKMVALIDKHPQVGFVSSYNITEESVRFSGLPTARNVVSGREIVRLHLLDGAYLFGAPTTVLYRSEIVRRRVPFYDEIFAEDLSACYEILKDWDFAFTHDILTFVRTWNESILSPIRNLARTQGFSGSAIDRFLMTHRHGSAMLENADDYHYAYRIAKRGLYKQMANGWLSRQGPDFWKLHRNALASDGLEIDKLLLIAHVLLELLRRIVNPGSTVASMLRRASGRMRRRTSPQ